MNIERKWKEKYLCALVMSEQASGHWIEVLSLVMHSMNDLYYSVHTNGNLPAI